MDFVVFLQILVGLFMLLVFLLTWKEPYRQPAILVALMPLMYFYFPPRSLNLFHIVDFILLLMFLASGKKKATSLEREMPEQRRFLWVMLGWLAGWELLGIFGVNFVETTVGVLSYGSIVFTLVTLARTGERGVDPVRLQKGFNFALVMCIGFVIAQLLVGPDLNMYSSLNSNVNEGGGTFEIRYPGPFRDAQTFGQFLAVMLAFAFFSRKRFKLDSQFLIALAGMVCLLLNGTRIALLGFLLGSGIALVALQKMRLRALIPIIVVMIGSVAVAIFVNLNNVLIVQRILEVEDSFFVRFAIWVKAWAIFLTTPLAGIGFNNFGEVIAQYDPSAVWHSSEGNVVFNHPESTYLKFLVETGVLGAILFGIMLIIVLRRYFRIIRLLPVRDPRKHFLAAGLAGFVTLMAGFITVYSLQDPRLQFLFAFLMAAPFLYTAPEPTSPVIENRSPALVHAG